MGFIIQPRNDQKLGLETGQDFKNILNAFEIPDKVLKDVSSKLTNLYLSLPEDKQETTIPVVGFSKQKNDWNMMGLFIRVYSDKEPIHFHDVLKFDEFQIATSALELNRLFSN